jgi:DNA invertase Pin-like site-specific DNA recombinase
MTYIYTRISTDQQSDASLEIQAETCKRWVSEPVTIIAEIGSGKNTERPKLQETISKLKPGDCIACYDNSRLARNMMGAILILNDITEKGAFLICDGKKINPEDPQDLFTYHIHSAFSDYQRGIQNQKSKEGLYRQYETGDAVFNGVLFGYDLSRKGRTAIVKVIPDEAKIVKYIYEKYAAGKSTYELGNELYGTPTQRGQTLNPDKVRRVILNPIYFGFYPDFRGKSRALTRYTREQLEPHLIKSNLYEPMIDAETWWRCFDRYRNVKQKGARNWDTRFTTHELSGMVSCFECGKPISHFTRPEKTMVRSCYEMHAHLPSCKTHYMTSWTDTWLERLFRLCFYVTFLSGDEVGSFFSERQHELFEDAKEIKQAIEKVNMSIEETQRKIDRLVDAIANGIISPNDAKKRMDLLKEDIVKQETYKSSLNNDLSHIEMDIDSFIELSSEEIIDQFPNSPRDFYKRFIKQGINYGDRLVLEYMNGKTYTIPKPYSHGRKIDPVKVTVIYREDTYEFSYLEREAPLLVKCGVQAYDDYVQGLLNKAWALINET